MMAQCIHIIRLHVFENEKAALFVGATFCRRVVFQICSQGCWTFEAAFSEDGDFVIFEVQANTSSRYTLMGLVVMCFDSLAARFVLIG
jgi:hypothetical protein